MAKKKNYFPAVLMRTLKSQFPSKKIKLPPFMGFTCAIAKISSCQMLEFVGAVLWSSLPFQPTWFLSFGAFEGESVSRKDRIHKSSQGTYHQSYYQHDSSCAEEDTHWNVWNNGRHGEDFILFKVVFMYGKVFMSHSYLKKKNLFTFVL